jgi:hypothetical protein
MVGEWGGKLTDSDSGACSSAGGQAAAREERGGGGGGSGGRARAGGEQRQRHVGCHRARQSRAESGVAVACVVGMPMGPTVA